VRFRLKHLSTTFLRYSAVALAGLVGSSCLKAEGILLSKSASAGGAITHAAALASDGTLYFGTRNASYGSGANLYSFKGASLASIANAQDDADGTPSIAADGTIYFGSWDGTLRAVKSDGSARWTYHVGAIVTSTPAIAADGTVYFGAADNRLHALTSAGVQTWSFAAGDWIESSPALCTDGTIVFGSWDGYVYALTTAGTQAWRYNASAPVVSSPAIGSTGNIYFATRDGRLVGLQSNGSKLYEISTGSSIESSPVIAPGAVYITTVGGEIIATGNGAITWRTSIGSAIYSSPTLRQDGSLLVSSGSQVVCVSSTGSILWRTTLDAVAEGSPTIDATGKIYVGGMDGCVYTISGSSILGTSVWPEFHRDAHRTGLAAAPVSSTGLGFEPDHNAVPVNTINSSSTSSNTSSVTPTPTPTPIPTSHPTPTPTPLPIPSPTPSSDPTTPTQSTAGASSGGRIMNLSARAYVGTGDSVAIAGFITSGSENKTLLVRGLGPTLGTLGVNAVLAKPQLQLYSGSTQLQRFAAWTNDSTLSSVSAQVGALAFAANSQDAAGVLQVAPGGYSVVTSGIGTTTGIVLLEVFDADSNPTPSSKLYNISCRAFVGTGEKALIGGVIIGGDGPVTLLVRVIGPTLTRYGVQGALANPIAQIHQTVNGADQVIATNDNWNDSSNANEIRSSSSAANIPALPEGSLDSAFLITLNPGGYTVTTSGADGGTGVALIELFRVD